MNVVMIITIGFLSAIFGFVVGTLFHGRTLKEIESNLNAITQAIDKKLPN